MAARDNLQPLQFKTFLDYPNVNQIRAYHGDTEIGHFHWAKESHGTRKTGEITHIGVDKPFRRKGIARQMYNMAKETGPEPLHSVNLEPLGRKFAKGIGGPWA